MPLKYVPFELMTFYQNVIKNAIQASANITNANITSAI
jgi:hypothetical protein